MRVNWPGRNNWGKKRKCHWLAPQCCLWSCFLSFHFVLFFCYGWTHHTCTGYRRTGSVGIVLRCYFWIIHGFDFSRLLSWSPTKSPLHCYACFNSDFLTTSHLLVQMCWRKEHHFNGFPLLMCQISWKHRLL